MSEATGWSPLAYGCEPLGGEDWGPVDVAELRASVRAALDHGISVYDTADVYGLGNAERELALALGPDRHKVVIVTKGGVRWGNRDSSGRAPTMRDCSAAYLTRAIDQSLMRLDLDAIPIYLVHWPDGMTPIDETIECLERACDTGKVRAYGLSNHPVDVIKRLTRFRRISAFEGPLSVVSTRAEFADLAGVKAIGLKTLTYGTLAQGLLTGKYSAASTFAPNDRRSRLPHCSADEHQRRAGLMRSIVDVSREVGCSPAQVAVRWALETGLSSSVIVGAKNPAQVIDNCAALSWSLSATQTKTLNEARRAFLDDTEGQHANAS